LSPAPLRAVRSAPSALGRFLEGFDQEPPAGAPSEAGSLHSLAGVIASLEHLGPAKLPRSLDDLARMGLSEALAGELRALVAAGSAESDVVRAVYEALASLVADGVLKAPVSRQFLRALRHRFARADECRELRRVVRAAVEAEVRAVAA
jgi:hypothetical protein